MLLPQTIYPSVTLQFFFKWKWLELFKMSLIKTILKTPQLDQGGLNLPTRDNYLNKTAHKKVLDAYLEYMTRICVLLGANKTEAREQMSKVIKFETDLANITIPSEDRRDEEGLYNPYTVQQWQKVAPFLNWSLFFNDAFKLVNRTVSNLIFDLPPATFCCRTQHPRVSSLPHHSIFDNLPGAVERSNLRGM